MKIQEAWKLRVGDRIVDANQQEFTITTIYHPRSYAVYFVGIQDDGAKTGCYWQWAKRPSAVAKGEKRCR